MKAIQVKSADNLEVVELPAPTAGPGEVRVKMEWGGICGSDVAYWRHGVSGTATLKEPLILGHEIAGTIDQIGDGVQGWNVGDKVTIHPATCVGDYEVPEHLKGRDNLWPEIRYFGSAAFFPHEQGGFSTYRVARADQLRKLPDNVSTKEGAIAEPLGVAIHAVNIAGPLENKRILVNGAGPIGALTVGALKHAGAEEVYVSDVRQSPLEIARALGADHLINRGEGEDLPENVDITFEASGVPATIGDCLMATVRGGLMVQVGNLPGSPTPINLGQLVTREITYKGSYRFIDEISDAVAAMAAGLDVTPVMTHEFTIEEALTAFETAADYSTGSSKVMIKLS